MRKIIFLAISLTVLSFTAKAQCSSGTSEIIISVSTKNYGNEIHWKIRDSSGQVVDSVKIAAYRSNTTYTDTFCAITDEYYTFEAWDSWGDGWDGGTYFITHNNKVIINNNGNSPSDGINQNGLDTIEVAEPFRLLIDTMPDVAMLELNISNYVNCNTNSEVVKATVTLNDTFWLDTIFAAYQLDADTIRRDTFFLSSPLGKDSIVEIAFAKPIYLVDARDYHLRVWLEMQYDDNRTNDTLRTTIISDSIKTNFPILENVENESLCGNKAFSCIGNNSCNLTGIWRNVDYDDTDWSVNSGTTVSVGTGPEVDHSKGDTLGKYLFVESSSCQNSEAILEANCFDLSDLSDPHLSFWYHMFGSNTGNLFVELDSGDGNWFAIDSIMGQQQRATSESWHFRNVDLYDFKWGVYNIRLRAVTGSTFASDIAIDDIRVGNVFRSDLLVDDLAVPANGSCGDSLTSFTATIKSIGADTVIAFSVDLKITGDTILDRTVRFNDSLFYNDTVTLVFDSINLSKGGDFNVQVVLSHIGDEDSTNNTSVTSLSLYKVPSIDPLTEIGLCKDQSGAYFNNTMIGDTTYWYLDEDAHIDSFVLITDGVGLGPINESSSVYYRNMHVVGNCYSAMAELRINHSFGIKGSLSLSDSSKALTDSSGFTLLAENDTIDYLINPPSGYNIDGYGTTWALTNIDAQTAVETPVTDSVFGVTVDSILVLSIRANALDVDSLFDINISMVDLVTGCDTTFAQQLYVYARPFANFVADTICEGFSTTFTDSTLQKSGELYYSWFFGDGDTSSQMNPSHKYTSYGSYNVKLVVSNEYGLADSIEKSVLVYPTPDANFSAQDVCEGDSTHLFNTTLIGYGSFTNFWSLGDGATSDSIDVVRLYADTGSYTVTLTSLSENGCIDSISKTIEMHQHPEAGFSIEDVCGIDSIRVNDSSSRAFNYFYSFHNDSSTLKNPVFYSDSMGSFSIRQVVINFDGCTDTAYNEVFVAKRPELDLTVNNACLQDSIEVLGSLPSHLDYTWAWGNGDTSYGVYNKYHYSTSGSHTIRVEGKANATCFDADTLQVIIRDNPVAQFMADTACVNDTMAFASANSAAIFEWEIDGISKYDSSFNYVFNTNGFKPVKLLVQDSFGCKDSLERNMLVNATPKASFNYLDVCLGDTSYFISTTLGADSLFWDFDNGLSSNDSNVSLAYSTSRNYNVMLSAFNNHGCSSSISQSVAVFSKPVVSFNGGSICLGDSFYFNTSNKTDTLTWNLGNGTDSSANAFSFIYQSPGIYLPKLVAKNAFGCKDSIVDTVQVFGNPEANFSASTACLTDSVAFANGSSSSLNYTWYFGDGSQSNKENPSHKYTSAGTYRVSLVAYSANNCKDSITKSIIIKPSPSLNFTLDSSICSNGVLNIVNSTVGANSYKWLVNGALRSNDSLPNIALLDTGFTWITLIVESSGNCSVRDSQMVYVNPKPIADFSVNNECFTDTTIFDNSSSVSKGSLSFQWTFGDGMGTSTLENPFYLRSTSGIFTNELIVRTNKGCTDTAIMVDTVYALPSMSFTSDTVCFRDSTTLINTSNTNKILWSYSGSNYSGDNIKLLFANSGTYNVTLSGISQKGCENSVTNAVQVFESPVANFKKMDVCFGDSTTFENLSTNYSSMVLNYGDGTVGAFNTRYKYDKNAFYTASLHLSNANGCKDSITKTVRVFAPSEAKFTANDTCFGDTVYFKNASVNSLKTQWNLGDGGITNAKNPKHAYRLLGSYLVQLISTSTNGCSDTLTQTVSINENPIARFTTKNICQGDSLQLSSLTSAKTQNVQWQLGADRDTALTSFYTSFKSAKTYNVSLIAESSKGCTDTLRDSIVVYKRPKAQFSTADVCLTDTAFFTNTSSDAIKSVWKFGNGKTSRNININHLYQKDGDYTVSLTVESTNGCLDSISKTIGIKPLPELHFTVDTAVCANETVALTNLTTGAQSFAWQFGSSITSTDSLPVFSFGNSGMNWVSLKAVSSNSCSTTDSVLVTSYSAPKVDFTVENECEGDTVYYYNNSTIAAGKLSYAWNFGNGIGFSNKRSPIYIRSTSGIFQNKLIATSQKGCKDSLVVADTAYAMPVVSFVADSVCFGDSTTIINTSNASNANWKIGSSNLTGERVRVLMPTSGTHLVQLAVESVKGCSASSSGNILVFNTPSANFAKANACLSDSIQFNNSSTNTDSIWVNYGDGFENDVLKPHKYQSAGIYRVKLVAFSKNGCVDSIAKNVEVYSEPVAGFSANDTCFGDTVYFRNASQNATQFQWNLGDGGVSSAENINYVYRSTGNYLIRLISSTKNGCSDTLEKRLNINTLPTAGFTSKSYCLNDSFKAANASVGAASYEWDFKDGTSSSQLVPLKRMTQSGTFYVQLKAISAFGCADTSSQRINVNALPTSDFSINGQCLNDTFTFVNTSSSDATTFNWTIPEYAFTSVNRDQGLIFPDTGKVTIELISKTAFGCSDTTQKLISIRDIPSVDFEAYDICFGDSITLSRNGDLANSAFWSLGDGNFQSLDSFQYYYQNPGEYFVQLAVFDAFCTNTLTKSVSVNETPKLDFNNMVGCLGAIYQLENDFDNENGVFYEWSIDSDSLLYGKSVNYLFPDTGLYSITLVGLDTNDCFSELNKTVVINKSPSAEFVANSLCEDQNTIFSPTESDSLVNYTWIIDGSEFEGDSVAYVFRETGEYNVQLNASADSSCVTQFSQQVVIGSKPTARFVSDLEVCENEKIEFLDLSTIPDNSTLSYEWILGNDTITELRDPIVSFSDSGFVDVTLLVSTPNGCKDTFTRNIQVHDIPEISIVHEEVGSFVYFDPIDTNASRYFWDFGNGETSRFKTPRSRYFKDGRYFVSLTIETDEGCEVVSEKTIRLTKTSTGELATESLQVYPVPFRSQLSILNPLEKELEYQVFDGKGRIVISDKLHSGENSISTDHLTFGVYTIKATINNRVVIKRIIKE